MVKTKNNKLLVVGAVGAVAVAVYALTNKGDENEQDFVVGGGGSGNAISEFLGESGLTGNQIDYLSEQIEASAGETTIETFDFDGVRGNTIVTSRNNERLFTSDIGKLANSNTFVAYTDDSGNIVGGSDFLNLQSVTAERASATKKDFRTALSIANNNQQVINNARSSSGSSIPAGAIGQRTDGSFIFGSSSGGSSKKSSKKKKEPKTDNLSGRDKGKGSYIVTKKDGSKSKRYFQ